MSYVFDEQEDYGYKYEYGILSKNKNHSVRLSDFQELFLDCLSFCYVVYLSPLFVMSELIFFVSFQDLLTRHKLLSAEFLEQHYDRVGPSLAKTQSLIKNCFA